MFAPFGLIELAVDDTRKRGLTLYGTGMRHDPLIPSRAKAPVSWGHDWFPRSRVWSTTPPHGHLR